MNPLSDFENYYHKVTTSKELLETMEKIISGHRRRPVSEYRRLVQRYWHLDPELTRWKLLLEEGIK